MPASCPTTTAFILLMNFNSLVKMNHTAVSGRVACILFLRQAGAEQAQLCDFERFKQASPTSSRGVSQSWGRSATACLNPCTFQGWAA